ncbi:DUF4381 domain-containing protein [Joostella sp. CR20]|uniref:DUF4381 domain-containing protein n=1 Tax=Joostella sp. CR20 TaxID=2804312 RepID=UPI00313D9CE7
MSIIPSAIQDSIPENLKNLQLEEIYEPQPIPFTFETVGWKILAALILLGILIAGYLFIRNYIKNAYRREAIKKLSEVTAVSEVLVILKMVALQTFGREEVGRLYGKSWLEFLDKTGKDVQFIPLEADIQNSVYKNEELDAQVKQQILTNSKKWIKSHA